MVDGPDALGGTQTHCPTGRHWLLFLCIFVVVIVLELFIEVFELWVFVNIGRRVSALCLTA